MRLPILLMTLPLLSACTWLAPPEALAPGEAEREKLRAISAWLLEGRINVRTADDNWTANLEWRHAENEEHIALNGPFAQRAATIHYKQNYIAFDSADGNHAESTDPEGLLLERLGFSIPLDALRYWVLALPAPGQKYAPQSLFADSAALSAFEQAGWSMRYDSFMREGAWVLPRKMVIQRRGVVLKLFVDRWGFDG